MGLYFDDIAVGQVFESEKRTVTESDIRIFAELTGDATGVHTDAAQAKASVFGSRVAHGTLVIGLAMGLLNKLKLFDGTAIAPLDLHWKFTKPVFLGDIITARLRVIDKRPTSDSGRGLMARQIEVINQTGITVQEGTSLMLLRTRRVP